MCVYMYIKQPCSQNTTSTGSTSLDLTKCKLNILNNISLSYLCVHDMYMLCISLNT